MEKIEHVSGAELVLSHAGRQLEAGVKLTYAERLGAMAASFSTRREEYGPTPKTTEPLDIPLPETVKGAIAKVRG